MKKPNIKLRSIYINALLNLLFLLLSPVVVISSEKTRESVKDNQTSLLFAQLEANKERQNEADNLFDDGLKLYEKSQFQESLIIFHKALIICKEINDKKCESLTLKRILYFSRKVY
ncbi:hypothetical protein [Nostoc favosum]|uniref:Tetratricopeptide repeat protein n=1 Tax=Nostoc favosum CHAB5714 TaxID=2780399 RepID=A0ABS8IHY6_9NOSO|nr:hypothetical protein [Nostoc favosum]MCC5603807.1 hypothetical protein [Nostoc favosum CHAB5714]